ncbi:MAG: gephyrin-like molybdotransferase Glp [Litorimonas sp.]
MISLSEALKLIVGNRPSYDVVPVLLKDALGARCAQDITAKITMPPFNASAMDGYAVKAQDANEGAKLTVIGQAPAGRAFEGHIITGQAVRIFTGGIIPDGADTIVIQENVSRNDDIIHINTAPRLGNAVRKAGIDFKIGDTLIPKGARITPAHIALAASGNHAKLSIHRRPKVALIANGDELREPGSKLKDGQIVSSNSAGLAALIQFWGADVMDMGIAADDLDSIRTLITQAKDADIIVPIGGASVGDYDYMKQAFAAEGYNPIFTKIAVKPGKPTWFGMLGEQRVLGLPGNPASANVCAHLCLKVLLGLSDTLVLTQAILDTNIAKNGPRETYLRGALYINSKGQLTVTPFPRQDSSLITPLAAANALVSLPPHGGPWQSGDNINVYPLGQGPDVFGASP